ncbi:MAG TPA: hypothetical protein VN947_02390 [Polyangia bacterium]|nr:hypothetical protein [Polyangia bacterium]
MTRLAFVAALLLSLPAGAATFPGTVCTDTPKLGYGSGPLIQNVKIVNVFYSPGHMYKAMLEDFAKAVVQSPYFDWLTEYNAGGYKIGRGSFVTTFEDNNANPAAIKSVDPETYLKSIVTAAKVPPPDDDTIYMLYFPSNVDPTDGSGPSCINNGDYCAYHSSYQATNGQMVRYGVIPDMDAGQCNQGCGPPGFASFTDVSSHELIEAVTDPDGSGWYDTGAPDTSKSNCGEIGDICAVGGTQETGMIGTFVVQNEWSNHNNACITVDPNVMLNDFTVAASAVEVPAGGSATTTVTVTKKSGMAENVTLSAASPPTGLTASFSPASVTSAGGTSMMTVLAAPTLAPGTMLTLTVKGTGSAASETATVAVSIVAPVDMAMSSGGSGGSGGGDHGGGGCAIAGVGGRTSAPALALFTLALFALAFRRRRV